MFQSSEIRISEWEYEMMVNHYAKGEYVVTIGELTVDSRN